MLPFARLRRLSTAVLLEHRSQSLLKTNLSAIKAASMIDNNLKGVIVAHRNDSILASLKNLPALREIYFIDHECQDSESQATLIAEVLNSRRINNLVCSHTTFGKNILPRIAVLHQNAVSTVADVVAIESPTVYVRPIFAGNALAKIRCDLERGKFLSVRATSFNVDVDNMEKSSDQISIIFESVNHTTDLKSEVIEEIEQKNARPDLSSSEIVVSGGRALKSIENFKLIYALADKLNAAVGASRAAVDSGFAPNELQVGQTGKIVAPRLYIAVGISGAIQHVAGMKDSQTIVAINKDQDCPIFKVSDLGLVGDLFQILPELTGKIKN